MGLLLKLAAVREQPLLERFLITHFNRLESRYANDVLPRLERLPLRDALAEAAGQAGWPRAVSAAYQQYLTSRYEITSGDPARVVTALAQLGHTVDGQAVEHVLDDTQGDDLRVRIRNALTASQVTEAPEFVVRLLTMHSAKGLSKGIVLMPGLEDKWIPGTSRDRSLAEKHGLFYVALTRAEREVHMSAPLTRARGDPLNYTPDGSTKGASRCLNLLRLAGNQP